MVPLRMLDWLRLLDALPIWSSRDKICASVELRFRGACETGSDWWGIVRIGRVGTKSAPVLRYGTVAHVRLAPTGGAACGSVETGQNLRQCRGTVHGRTRDWR